MPTPTHELLQFVPQLSLAERGRRWSALRNAMAAGGFDALLFLGSDSFWDAGMANFRYIFQVGSKMGGWALFPASGEPIVWHGIPHMTRPIEIHHTRQEWVHDFRPFTGPPPVIAEIRARKLDRAHIGIVAYTRIGGRGTTLTEGTLPGLRAALPHCEFTDVSPALNDLRLIKSDEELAFMRTAGTIGRKAIDTMLATARPGVTEAALWAEMLKTQLVNGAEPDVFNLLSSGPVEHDAAQTWFLLHGAPQPMVPTMRPLAEGDVVIAEFRTRYGGYLCAAEYTVYVGRQAPDALAAIFDVCAASIRVAREVLVPGTTMRRAWEAIREPCRTAGYDYLELGWHGVGLAAPEYPTVVYPPDYGIAAFNGEGVENDLLRDGMTLGTNADIHNPAWKNDVGCKLGGCIVVRAGGGEPLIDVPTTIGASLER